MKTLDLLRLCEKLGVKSELTRTCAVIVPFRSRLCFDDAKVCTHSCKHFHFDTKK